MEIAVQPKSSTRGGLAALSMSLLSMTAIVVSNGATAQQIVKWTDESGHVHYSDHAPAGHTSTNSVAVSKAPAAGGTAPATEPPPASPDAPRDALDPRLRTEQAAQAGMAMQFDSEQAAAADHARWKREAEEQQRANEQARKKAQQDLLHKCLNERQLNCRDLEKSFQ